MGFGFGDEGDGELGGSGGGGGARAERPIRAPPPPNRAPPADGLAGAPLDPPSSSPVRRAALPLLFPTVFAFAAGEMKFFPLQTLLFT